MAMASKRYANLANLKSLFAGLKQKYAPITHAHSASDITSGTLDVARGGTGAVSSEGARQALGIDDGYVYPRGENLYDIIDFMVAIVGGMYGFAKIAPADGETSVVDGHTVYEGDAITPVDGTHIRVRANGYSGNGLKGLSIAIGSGSDMSVYYRGSVYSLDNRFTWGSDDVLEFVCQGGDLHYVGNQKGSTPEAHVHDAATTTSDGMMSASDKARLDGIGGLSASDVAEIVAAL